ncbi:unnamed protein product, partial [Rotaria sp. Silwood2]
MAEACVAVDSCARKVNIVVDPNADPRRSHCLVKSCNWT